MGRFKARGCWLLTLTAVMLLGIASTASAATTSKPYALVISPAPPGTPSPPAISTASDAVVASGEAATITATFTNETTTQQLGSANLFAPSGFTFAASPAPVASAGTAVVSNSCTYQGVSAGPCVELRNLALAPGQSATVTVAVNTPACQSGDWAWVGEAKQANDFSGTPGNDLTPDTTKSQPDTALDGACSLAFAPQGQPANALINQAITTTNWNSPPGGPVAIQVLDQNGLPVGTSSAPITMTLGSNPGGASLAGTTLERASGGTASFGDLSLNAPANGYTLVASSGTLRPATSNSFDTASTFANCAGAGTTCATNASGTGSSAQVTANVLSGSGLLLESPDANQGAPLTCAGYAAADANTYSFLTSTGLNASTVLTTTITSPDITLSGSPNQILKSLQICFGVASPTPNPSLDFVTSAGTPAPYVVGGLPDGSSGYIGLLPDCKSGFTGPCHDRKSDTTVPDPTHHLGYDLVVVADIPAAFSGDPFNRI